MYLRIHEAFRSSQREAIIKARVERGRDRYEERKREREREK